MLCNDVVGFLLDLDRIEHMRSNQPRCHSRLDQIVDVRGDKNAVTGAIHRMPGASDTLNRARNAFRSRHHDDEVDGADVADGGANGLRPVAQNADLDAGRHGGREARQFGIDAVDRFDDVGAGLLENDEEDAALAIGPGGLLAVLGGADGIADILQIERRSVLIADDDVIPLRHLDELVVGVDGVAVRRRRRCCRWGC